MNDNSAILYKQVKDLPQVALLRLFPAEWIGQGFGYKLSKNWEDMQMDEVIYVPEYGYEGVPLSVENMYTKKDFIDITGNDTSAQILFDLVDWQSPETLHNELCDNNEEYCKFLGPCVYNCPERILKEAEKSTVPCKGWAREWRDKCWSVIEKRKKAKKLKDGDIIKFPQTLEFISGFRGDTFVFRKSGRQVYFESLEEKHLVYITNWRNRDFELVSA